MVKNNRTIEPIKESLPIGDELMLEMETVSDSDGAETLVEIDGVFWVDAKRRMEFKAKVEALINDFRI